MIGFDANSVTAGPSDSGRQADRTDNGDGTVTISEDGGVSSVTMPAFWMEAAEREGQRLTWLVPTFREPVARMRAEGVPDRHIGNALDAWFAAFRAKALEPPADADGA